MTDKFRVKSDFKSKLQHIKPKNLYISHVNSEKSNHFTIYPQCREFGELSQSDLQWLISGVSIVRFERRQFQVTVKTLLFLFIVSILILMGFWACMESPKTIEMGTMLIPCGICGTLLEPHLKQGSQVVPPPVFNDTQVVPAVKI